MGGDTARAAIVYGVFGTAWALMQFLFSPVLGSLSDRFGRRPIILLSNFGLGLDYILMALAPKLGWLFVGRVISGITAASVSTAGAYIADVTPPEQRAAKFGLLGAAFGAGFRCRPGARRPARRHQPAAAVLGRGCTQPRQRDSMACSCCPSRCRGTTLRVLMAQGESVRRTQAAALASRAVGIHLGDVPQQPRARRAAQRGGALHELSLRLGHETGRRAARGSRRVLDPRAGRAGRPRGQGARRATRRSSSDSSPARSDSRSRRWGRSDRCMPSVWSSCRCGD